MAARLSPKFQVQSLKLALRFVNSSDKKVAGMKAAGANWLNFVFPLMLLLKTFFTRRGSVLPLTRWLLMVGFPETLTQAQPYGLTNRAPLAPFLNDVAARIAAYHRHCLDEYALPHSHAVK